MVRARERMIAGIAGVAMLSYSTLMILDKKALRILSAVVAVFVIISMISFLLVPLMG